MKKQLLTFVLYLLPILANAFDAEINGIYYNFSGDEATVTSGSPMYSGAVIVPVSVIYNSKTYSVTGIGNSAFSDCYSLTSITIPNSVTSIGNEAFCRCSNLTSIQVESGNTVYDSRNNCNAIIETATGKLISGCQNTVIPNSVTSIGESAFELCSGLTSITIPNSVTSIGNAAFSGCSSLTSLTIPNSVTSIGDHAISACGSLTSVTISNSVTSIGNNAFSGCYNLLSVTIPYGVTSIGESAFEMCNALTSVSIPNSVTSIGTWAFRYCTSLASITIPNSVASIGDGAFFETAWYNNQPDGLIYVGKIAYKYKGIMPEGTHITIEDGTLEISAGAFEMCGGLTSITIPNSVTSIGNSAFYDCNSLTSVTLTNSVTSIGDYAFSECSSLTSIIIPNSVTSIGREAFNFCTSLTSITIPNSVTSIGSSIFRGCNILSSIKVAGGNTKYDSREDCNAIIETSTNTMIAACKNTTIPNSVTSIGYGTFFNCDGLTSITIPNSVTSIGIYAFGGCTGLTSITIPNSVTSIGNLAFNGCTSLTSIIIPNSVTSIGNNTFSSCNSLTSVTIPESVTSIGNSAFSSCTGLSSITIPNSVTSIGNDAFARCSNLTSVTIPSSITSIGNYAFHACSELTSVTADISTPLTITSNVFSNCANATLYVPMGSKAAYEAADFWKEFKEIVEIIDPDAEDTDISTLDNTIYINKVEVYSGTEATVSIQMKNTAAIRGFQFDLYLPEGVTVVKNDKGRIQAALNKSRVETDDEHTLTCSEQEDGAIRFLCGSQYEETFTGNDGEIATLQVIISASVEDGEYPLLLRDIKLSETDINKYYEVPLVKTKLTVSSYMPGDINADAKVDVSDYIGVANHILGHTPEGFVEPAGDVDNNGVIDISDYLGIGNIIHTGSVYGSYKVKKQTNLASELSTMDNVIYVSNITVNAGGTATLSLCMKNSVSIRGFQFDLYLPEGITAAVNNKRRIMAALTNVRLEEGDDHTLTTSQQEDGCIRFLCGSQYEENFTGNDGEIATLTVNVDAEMLAGDYPISLKNMKLSESDIRKYYETAQVDSIISVAATTGIVLTGAANNPLKDCYYNIAGQRVISTKKGVYIHHGRKIIVK